MLAFLTISYINITLSDLPIPFFFSAISAILWHTFSLIFFSLYLDGVLIYFGVDCVLFFGVFYISSSDRFLSDKLPSVRVSEEYLHTCGILPIMSLST
mgnify:CR=1 FL=1